MSNGFNDQYKVLYERISAKIEIKIWINDMKINNSRDNKNNNNSNNKLAQI